MTLPKSRLALLLAIHCSDSYAWALGSSFLIGAMCMQAPFTYQALPPEAISFVPLKQTQTFNAQQLFQVRSQLQCSCQAPAVKLWQCTCRTCLCSITWPCSHVPAARGADLQLALQHYKAHDERLRKFLPIIESSLVYPVITDAQGTVLSLPPIINGAHPAVRPHLLTACLATCTNQ